MFIHFFLSSCTYIYSFFLLLSSLTVNRILSREFKKQEILELSLSYFLLKLYILRKILLAITFTYFYYSYYFYLCFIYFTIIGVIIQTTDNNYHLLSSPSFPFSPRPLSVLCKEATGISPSSEAQEKGHAKVRTKARGKGEEGGKRGMMNRG